MPRLPLTRLVYRAAIAPAVQQHAALYLGVLIAAVIVFQPTHGLRAAQVTGLMAVSRAVRLFLWAGWLLLTLPAARALLRAPALLPLRALPVAPWRFLAVLGGALVLGELPFGLLGLRGVGPLTGLSWLLGAAAAHGVLLARRPRPAVALSALGALALADGQLPAAAGALIAACALPLGLHGAWRGAAEPPAAPLGAPLRGPAPLALLLYHLVVLVRGERAALLRALVLVLGAGAVAWLCARNNDMEATGDRLVVGLATLSLALPVGAAAIGARALGHEASARWILDSTGVGGAARVLGCAGAVAIAGAGLGAAGTALYAGLLGGPAPGLLPQSVLCAAAIAVLVVGLLRRVRRGDERDGDRAVIVVVLLIAAAEVLLYLLRPLQPAVLSLAAILLSVASMGWAAPRGRRARRRFGVSAWTGP